MPAVGTTSGTTYDEADIFDDHKYVAMRNESLLSANDEIVIPVRNRARPHFRRIGGRSFGVRIGRSENNPTHNKCVDHLLAKLTSATNVVLSVYAFDTEGNYDRQAIFTNLPGSTYRWFKEADARIAFCDETYIQPDIGGRDVGRFFPRSSSPNILIEVVRTHAPDLDTFEKLHELSLANTIVAFYFIAVDSLSGKLNHFPSSKNANLFELRVSHYMINGEVYRHDKVVFPRNDQKFDAWYRQLSVSYFKAAQAKA